MLGVQIVTGIVLAMHYTPHVDLAFNSVEHIMRDVNYGWLLRYLHANGASMFFIAVYIHMFRGLYYGSYKEPREVLWILGVHHLPADDGDRLHGLRAALGPDELLGRHRHHQPVLGHPAGRRHRSSRWLWGGFAVGNPTLNRFFSLHYLLPFVIAGVVVLHVWALHVVGQNNPDRHRGEDRQGHRRRSRPTRPSRTASSWSCSCIALRLVRVLHAELSRPSRQLHPGQSGGDAAHIVPEWYYLPFYAILRAIPNKLLGVIALFASIVILAFLPWLDTSQVRSARYRPLYRQFFWIFVVVCVGLGWLGSQAGGRRLCRSRRASSPSTTSPTSWSSCRCSA